MSVMKNLKNQKNIEIIKNEINEHYSYNSDDKNFWLMNLDLREFDSYDYRDLLSKISKKIDYNYSHEEKNILKNFKIDVLDVFIKKEVVKILNEYVDSVLDLYIDNVVKNEYGRIFPEKINHYILKYYGVKNFLIK